MQTDRKRPRDHECHHTGGDQHRQCPDVRQPPARVRAFGKLVTYVGEAEFRVLRGRQRRAPRQRQFGFGGSEDRHREGLFELRHGVAEATGGADNNQRFGCPLDPGEYCAQPPDQIFVVGDRVIERGLHGAIAVN